MSSSCEPRRCAAAEVAHRGRELGAREPEPLEQLARRDLLAVDLVRGAGAADHGADPVVLDLREIPQPLVEDRDLDRLAALHPPGRRVHGAGDEAEQRRLARPR